MTELASRTDAPVARMGYQPGLDGLRALSVVLVILYHAGVVRNAEAAPGTRHAWFVDGGFLGVEVFFVVSGFLITSLLLEERLRTGGVSLRQFWFRRFRRLLPALWVTVAACGVWATFWGHAFLADLRWDSFFGLFYGANFQQLFGKVSYFGGAPHLLRHLWSLSVEEHFYLLFPPLFALMLRRRSSNPRRLLKVVLGAAAASALLLVLVWSRPRPRLTDQGVQLDDLRQNWAYLSTFTRAAGILIGVALALVWSPWRQRSPDPIAGHRLDVLGLLAMVGVVVAALTLSSESTLLYRGGLTAVSLLSAVAIAAVVHPHAQLMRAVFGNKAMAAVGRRSYGLYLWHWPIFVGPFSGRPIWERLLFGGTVTVVASELCYRYVETPIRQGAFGRWVRTLRRERVRSRGNPHVVSTVACVAGFGLLAGALVVRLGTADRVDSAGRGPAEYFESAAGAPTTVPGTDGIPGPGADSVAPGATTSVAGVADAPSAVGTAERSRRTPATAPVIPLATVMPPLPRRLVLVGDSQADALYHNLPNGLAGTFSITNGALRGCGVVDEGKIRTTLKGFGLAFSYCKGWAEKWAAKATVAKADVALVLLGAWDVFDLDINGRVLVFGTPDWDAYWLDHLHRGISALEATGAKVALLEVACMRPQEVKFQGVPPLPERADDSRTAHVNELLARAAAEDPANVFYVPGPRQWCEDETVARDLLYRWDGVHASAKGGKLIMQTIAPWLLSIPVDPNHPTPTAGGSRGTDSTTSA